MKTRSGLRLIKISLLICLFFLVTTKLVQAAGSDVNGDGQVNWQDVISVLQNWGRKTSQVAQDLNADLVVNSHDLGIVFRDWGKTITSPTPQPTLPPAQPSEWTQFAHDPQRTSYNPQNIGSTWTYKWQWNGSDVSVDDWVPMRVLAQPITGGNYVYVEAGFVGGSADKVYALSKSNGSVVWNVAPGGELSNTPAYSDGYLFVTSDNGTFYKLNAANGQTVSIFTADSALSTPPLLVGDRVYFTSKNGTLYALDKNTTQKIWNYTAGAQAATMPSYSASRNIIIFNDRELYVHAVDTNGNRVWRVKPTARTPFYGHPSAEDMSSTQASFDYGWPVVADNSGIVLVRYRLNWNTLWDGPGKGGAYPTTNEAIREFLESNKNQQCLFAIDLDYNDNETFIPAFIPAVGNAAIEGDNNFQLIMGPQPAIRRLNNGKEVAYIIWRNSLAGPGSDGRSDASLGEMVLDSSLTISGCANPTSTKECKAGDLRFVKTEHVPTDESGPVTAAGNFVFHTSWTTANSTNLGSSPSGGSSYDNAMGSIGPYVNWAQKGGTECSFNTSTRWCSSLSAKNNNRNFGPGFYVLYNDDERYWASPDPYGWNYDPFTVVSDSMILFKSIDGAIFVVSTN